VYKQAVIDASKVQWYHLENIMEGRLCRNTILLTGVGLWGNETYNSSWDMLDGVCPKLPDGWRCKTRRLPVSWMEAPKLLESYINPDVKVVICFGMSSKPAIQVERIAVNLLNPAIAAADNIQPESEYVSLDGPPAYWTGLPYKEICDGLLKQSIPVQESRWAGEYLCNYIFYWLMHYIDRNRPDIVGGFIHVPKYKADYGIKLEELRRAVEVIAGTAVNYTDSLIRSDIKAR